MNKTQHLNPKLNIYNSWEWQVHSEHSTLTCCPSTFTANLHYETQAMESAHHSDVDYQDHHTPLHQYYLPPISCGLMIQA